jgi:4-hydroxythreonine-4-phosphate dehydrogenase
MKNKPILLVAGEPYSVFSEIFFKTLKLTKFKKPIILIASQKLILKQMKALNYDFKFNLIHKKSNFLNLKKGKIINIINVDFKFDKTFTKISDNSNLYIKNCFKVALELLSKKDITGLVNGPISKRNFLKKKYLGITEYLADKTNRKNNVAMLIYNAKLSVSPITTHLPLKKVHKEITQKKIFTHVKLIREFYQKKFKKNPRIAITGLNPHCESNYESSEEELVIRPTINELFKKKYRISGPFSADTIFMKENLKKYDVIIGMYHDQVLTPAKALFGFNAINVTLGLPFLRISPDHGPNTMMLGKNLSNPTSLIQAIKFLDK